MKTAIVTASKLELHSIGICQDNFSNDDLTTGSEVSIINANNGIDESLGIICEVEYMYDWLTFLIPKKWLKIIKKNTK